MSRQVEPNIDIAVARVFLLGQAAPDILLSDEFVENCERVVTVVSHFGVHAEWLRPRFTLELLELRQRLNLLLDFFHRCAFFKFFIISR